MKKELLIASLMLTSPAALAHSVDEAAVENPMLHQSATKATWVFEANEFIRMPRYDYNDATGNYDFSHNDVVQTSAYFFPVDSKSDLFDFALRGFDPIKENEQEFEVAFRTHNISKNEAYFESRDTYYGVKKGDTVYLFDCDSTKSCNAEKDSRQFAILKIKKDGSMRFAYTAENFNSPYLSYSYETGKSTDLGTKLKFALKK